MNIVERSSPPERLVTELETAFTLAGGPPKVLRMDNGPKLVSHAPQQFCVNKTGLVYIPPGRPWVNGHIESFNNRLRKAVPFPQEAQTTKAKQPTSEPDNHFSVTLGVPPQAGGAPSTRYAENCILGKLATDF
jgi:transposase InsO family protein